MTNHLPECPAPLCDWGDPSAECMGYEDCHHLCCCAALRACEQRVEETWSAIAGRDQYAEGYAAALNAARDAVAVVGVRKDTSYDMRVVALAAIDALRGSGNPDTPPSAEKGAIDALRGEEK